MNDSISAIQQLIQDYKIDAAPEFIYFKYFCNIKVVDYSTKSIAIVGNTFPVKDSLKTMFNARFNKSLTVNNEKVPGWIIDISMKPKVLEWMKQE